MKVQKLLKLIENDKEFLLFSSEKETACMLSELARISSYKMFLEIGTHLGYTTVKMLAELDTVYAISVDVTKIHKKYTDKLPISCKKRVKYVHLPVSKFYSNLSPEEKYDMVFVDADHSFMGVFRDIVHLLPHVGNNSIIVFHDSVNPKFPGIQKLIRILRILNLAFCGLFADIITLITPAYKRTLYRNQSGLTIVRITNNRMLRNIFSSTMLFIYGLMYIWIIKIGLSKSLSFEQKDRGF